MSRQIIILGIGLALAPSVAHAQSLIGLRVEGPTEVIEETVTLYSVIAEFDNGWEFDVTLDSFLWVDPGLHADIGVFGDLQAYEVTTDGLETINAIYAFGPDIESATLDVTVRNVGLPGFALGFDGADDVAGLGWDLIPWSTSGTTIEAWFRTTAAGVLIGHQTSLPYGTPSDNVPIIYVGNDGKLRAEYWWGSQSPVTSGQPVNDDLWHHVGIRYENPDFDVWLDGVHVGSRSTTLVGFGVPFFYQVGVGYTVGWPSTNGHWFPFDGLIDEMRSWNIARSEEDIARDMNRTLAGNEAGLVGYWRFDEGQGQYALDSSPYGNDGVLGGAAVPAGAPAGPQWALSGAGLTCVPAAGHGLVFGGGDHVLVPDSASLSMTSSLTIETWAR
ncbi:MAG: LamG domain-containing protein, partial [bacterium]|nr:LamG domain-containing protein [bacterium]